jgi:hypothetical protein
MTVVMVSLEVEEEVAVVWEPLGVVIAVVAVVAVVVVVEPSALERPNWVDHW